MLIKARAGIVILIIALAGQAIGRAEETTSLNIMVGRSMVVDIGAPIARVSLTSPDVADAMVTSPAQLLVHGKMPGVISMFVWDRGGALRRYDVVVERDLTRLATQVVDLFPGERIGVQRNGKAVVLTGSASSKYVADKAVEVAAGYVEKKEDVVNLLQVQTLPPPATQVLLRVRFAEVSRNAMTELGASLFTSPTGVKNTLARVTTEQFAAPGFDDLKWTKESSDFGSKVKSAEGKFTFSDFLNVFLFSQTFDIGAMVRLLSTRGLFESLAEPNLVAESGKEASFLAGGEIPIPIAQGTGGNVAISVQYKEFGIRLNFTPTVIGNRVHLKVRPEVSTLDFSNGIVMQGFRIPALSTRRADTEIELEDRQTFAIAGLLNNAVTQSLQKVPGIGDIPILGLLFKSKAAQKSQSELVVMITPEILPRNSPGVTSQLPRMTEPLLPVPPANKTFPVPPPAFQPAAGSGGANAAPAAAPPIAAAPSDATTAAAAVAALTPKGPRIAAVPPAPAPAAAPPPRPLSKDEEKALERAKREEKQRTEADLRVKAEERKREVKLAEEQERKDRQERERQAVLAREQARRDAEQAKRDAETAKKQAEIDKKRQQRIDEAAMKVKAAERAYQEEIGRRAE